LVISANAFNRSPADMAVIVPLSSTIRPIPYHVHIDPPEGGITVRSSILCEQARAISRLRLSRRLGVVSSATLDQVEERLHLLLDLS
jgi:mRNA interferase MazF